MSAPMDRTEPSPVEIEIDGAAHEAEAGESLLPALRRAGKKIPALCYHPALHKPIGVCQLCMVSVQTEAGAEPKLRRACITKVRAGMAVVTDSDAIRTARSKAMNGLLAYAPQSATLARMARDFGLDTNPLPDGCIRCHLCYRVCGEIVGASALKLEHIEGHAFIVPVPGKCIGCGTCANVCPTNAITVEDHENVRTVRIRDEIIGQHPLERCEGCGRYFATPKFLEHIDHRTLPHPHVKEQHHYCPTCAKLMSDRIKSARSH